MLKILNIIHKVMKARFKNTRTGYHHIIGFFLLCCAHHCYLLHHDMRWFTVPLEGPNQ